MRVIILTIITFASHAQASKVLPVRLQFAEREKFELKLYNYDGDHLLWQHKGRSQGEGELFIIDPQPYTQYGVKKFRLLIIARKKIDTVYFRVDHNGSVIKE